MQGTLQRIRFAQPKFICQKLKSTGTLIGTEDYSSTSKCVVKLDQVGSLGYREIVVVPEVSVGKRVPGEVLDAALAAPRDMTVQVTAVPLAL